jgi:hypothetical protein
METMKPLYIQGRELHRPGAELGFLELSTDEQIAKKIYEVTGDKVFKGFLPLTWNTDYVLKMRDAMQRLTINGKPPTVLQMQIAVPSVSASAHQYFLTNNGKIKGIIPDNIQLPTPEDLFKKLTPILIIAGLGVGAFFLAQVKSFLPRKAAN